MTPTPVDKKNEALEALQRQFTKTVDFILSTKEPFSYIHALQAADDLKNVWNKYMQSLNDKAALTRQSDEVVANLDHLKREVRKHSEGHDLVDDDFDIGWNGAVKKCSEYYATAMTLKAAWEKRAYEAEAKISILEKSLKGE